MSYRSGSNHPSGGFDRNQEAGFSHEDRAERDRSNWPYANAPATTGYRNQRSRHGEPQAGWGEPAGREWGASHRDYGAYGLRDDTRDAFDQGYGGRPQSGDSWRSESDYPSHFRGPSRPGGHPDRSVAEGARNPYARALDDRYSPGEAQARRGGSHFDPDYQSWRQSKLQEFDDQYDDWRRERYQKFSDDFDQWRANRATAGASGTATGHDKAGERTPQSSAGGAGTTSPSGSEFPTGSGSGNGGTPR